MSNGEANKAAVRRTAEVVFNGRQIDRLGEFFTDDVVDHTLPPGTPQGLGSKRAQVEAFLTAFSDLKIEYQDQVAEGDKVAGRVTMTGTHDGEMFGIPPTGKSISVSGMDVLRFADGKIAEHWAVIDQLSMMQQLGLAPTE